MNIENAASSQLHALDLIRGVLNEQHLQLTEDLVLGDIAGWDSVTMVRLVVALEENLGRQLSDSELESIETVADVEKLVQARQPL
jgi:acyl carrier protein